MCSRHSTRRSGQHLSLKQHSVAHATDTPFESRPCSHICLLPQSRLLLLALSALFRHKSIKAISNKCFPSITVS